MFMIFFCYVIAHSHASEMVTLKQLAIDSDVDDDANTRDDNNDSGDDANTRDDNDNSGDDANTHDDNDDSGDDSGNSSGSDASSYHHDLLVYSGHAQDVELFHSDG